MVSAKIPDLSHIIISHTFSERLRSLSFRFMVSAKIQTYILSHTIISHTFSERLRNTRPQRKNSTPQQPVRRTHQKQT